MIELSQAVAREPPLAVMPLTMQLAPSVSHALVGTPADGVGLVLGLIAGTCRARTGKVRVNGKDPRSASVRRSVGFVPLDVALPEAMYVDEALAIASAIRGEAAVDPVSRLGMLGIADLARRKVGHLAVEQVRAVAMAEALTSTCTRVIVLEEPLVKVDPRALAALPGLFRDRVRAGACIVLSTSSLREACDLASVQFVFDRGVLVRELRTLHPVALASTRGVRMRVQANDNRVLAAALARDGDVVALTCMDDGVVLEGPSPAALGRAVARAIEDTRGLDVELVRLEPLEGVDLRAALGGDAAGTYRAAFDRAQLSARPGGAGPA